MEVIAKGENLAVKITLENPLNCSPCSMYITVHIACYHNDKP